MSLKDVGYHPLVINLEKPRLLDLKFSVFLRLEWFQITAIKHGLRYHLPHNRVKSRWIHFRKSINVQVNATAFEFDLPISLTAAITVTLTLNIHEEMQVR